MVNYFELFEIDPSYDLEKSLVEERYVELQEKYHPDNFIETDDQLKAMEMVMSVNNAYEILRDKNKFLIHYLSVNGVKVSIEEAKQLVPRPDLLYIFELKGTIKSKRYLREALKEKIEEIRLALIKSIKRNNKTKIRTNLSRLVFFINSLKNIG